MINVPVPSRVPFRHGQPALATFAICLAMVLAIQILTGWYRVERGIYSDDAAHFMNGMVLRDYLRHAAGDNPMQFAESYYLHYPKIAPFMWPPLFHVALGLFLLPGWPPGAASLVFEALVTAWLAWRLHHMVRLLAGPLAGWLAVILLVTTPIVQAMSGVVMLDLAIAATSLEAVYWLARYAESDRRRDAVLFGVFAAAACLTKGNGVAVVLVPPFFMMLTGRYDLLRKSGLYIAAAIVLVFAAPILAISARLDAAIGDFGPLTAALLADRVRFFSAELWTQLSPILVVLSLTSIAMWFRRRGEGSLAGGPAFHQALAALAAASITFHVLSPHLLSLPRYLTMVMAPVIGIAMVAVTSLASRAPLVARPAVRGFAVAGVVVVAVFLMRPALHRGVPLGFRDVAGALASTNHLASERILIVSDEIGEGAFVTEIAVLGLDPKPMVVRGSKLLASDDWGGHHFALRYETAAALLTDLEQLHVGYVLLDQSRGARQLAYFPQVESLGAAEPGRFQLVRANQVNADAGPSRPLSLYRITSPSAGPAKPMEINLAYSLGRSISR
jgi:hypothetical protein